jgi:hypothetical protein
LDASGSLDGRKARSLARDAERRGEHSQAELGNEENRGLPSAGCPCVARRGREFWALRIRSMGERLGRWLTTRSVEGSVPKRSLGTRNGEGRADGVRERGNEKPP